MDRKLKSDDQWYISPLITLRDFLEEAWNADVQLRNALYRPRADVVVKEEDYHSLQLMKDFTDFAGCSHATTQNIFEKDLALTQLVDDDAATKKMYEDDMQDEVAENMRPQVLRTHAHLQANIQNMNTPQKKSNYLRTIKYDRFDDFPFGLRREIPQWNQTSDKDIVIMVSVLCPYNKILSHAETRNSRIMQPNTKFVLRGDSTLYSLRKELKCVSDLVIPLEDGKELEPYDMQYSTMMHYPSSFIFINDTFYVDYSHPNATDISEPIREFMARKKCFDPVVHKSMENIKIIDLKLRLGQPYVFQHSGTCEHLLIFHDLRLLHKSDCQDITKYPILAYEKGGDSKCSGCKTNFATYRVEGSDRLPAPSVLFCDDCFAEFNFSHGVKIGSFRAYPYYQLNRIGFL